MKYTSKLLAISASIISINILMTKPVLAQTLVEAVSKTINNNPTIQAEVSQSLSVERTIDQARSGYYPKLDLSLGTGYERSDNPRTRPDGDKSYTRSEAEITASQMLYDGFATKNAVAQATSLAESAGYTVTDTAETTSLSAISAYLQVLRNEQLLRLSEENLANHERIFSQIQLRADSGVGTRVDLEQAKGRLALAQANVTSDVGNLADAEARYLRVIGELPDSLQDPGKECCDGIPATIEDAIKVAYHQHPALRASVAAHEASLAQYQGSKATMQPTVNLELSASADNNLDGTKGYDNDALAMIRMRYNLLNGGADSAYIDQTEYVSEQVKQQALITKREIENDVRLAWNSLEKITSQLDYLELYVNSSEKTRDAYQQQFNIGQRTLLDLLDTENELFTSRVDYTDAYYEQIYTCYWLIETMGKLLETLQLASPQAQASSEQ